MKTYILAFSAIGALALTAIIAFRFGQHRPAVIQSEWFDGQTISCGWDWKNKCVAVWFQSSNETQWIRVTPLDL